MINVQRGASASGSFPPHSHDHDIDLTHVGVTAHVDIDAHIAASAAVHGLTGTVVGTTDSQTLTNKTLTSPTLTTPTIASFVNALHTHVNSAGGGQLDHGAALTGLTDDDHTIYVKADGTRAMTAKLQVTATTNQIGADFTYTGASSASVGPRLAFIVNDGAAVASGDRLGQVQWVGYNGSGLANGGVIMAKTTELWSGTARGMQILFYTVPNTTTVETLAMTLDQNQDLVAAGNVNIGSGKVYKVNATQVVAARDTGWTAMTGSTNKATSYDTSTVTLAQLAGRVMALQAALTTHGLLGA